THGDRYDYKINHNDIYHNGKMWAFHDIHVDPKKCIKKIEVPTIGMNMHSRCNKCKKTISAYQHVLDDKYYCYDCFVKIRYICTQCHKNTLCDNVTNVIINNEPRWLCTECLNKNTIKCKLCEMIYHSSDVNDGYC